MIDQETLAEFVLWAAKNISFNLDFIAEEKLAWKPAAESNSVLEIINHIGENFTRFNAGFGGSPPSAYTPVTTAVAAKQMLLDVAHEFAHIIRQAEPAQLAQKIRVHGMKVAVKQAATMLVIDTINHHGQVTYIQTLLGDVQSHFDGTAFQHIAS